MQARRATLDYEFHLRIETSALGRVRNSRRSCTTLNKGVSPSRPQSSRSTQLPLRERHSSTCWGCLPSSRPIFGASARRKASPRPSAPASTPAANGVLTATGSVGSLPMGMVPLRSDGSSAFRGGRSIASWTNVRRARTAVTDVARPPPRTRNEHLVSLPKPEASIVVWCGFPSSATPLRARAAPHVLLLTSDRQHGTVRS
jgi:hypothetical protein